MRFDIVIRTFNSAETLGQCLRSLPFQDPKFGKLTAVDSGSTDQTQEILKGFDVETLTYPKDAPFNYSKSLNIGIRNCHHDLCLLVSSHVLVPEMIGLMESVIGFFEEYPECVGVYFTSEECSDGEFKWQWVDGKSFNGFNGLFNSCAVIRKSFWETCQFREDTAACEDQMWADEAFKRGYKTVRVLSPNVQYLNPRSLAYKKARDIVIVSRHFRPDLRSFGNIGRQIGLGLHAYFNWNGSRHYKRYFWTAILLLRDRLSTIKFDSGY